MGTSHNDISIAYDMADRAERSARNKKWNGRDGIQNLNRSIENSNIVGKEYTKSLGEVYPQRKNANKGD
jgi:hypothetical protein